MTLIFSPIISIQSEKWDFPHREAMNFIQRKHCISPKQNEALFLIKIPIEENQTPKDSNGETR